MPPTFLMGMSLPVLVRALVREPGVGATRVVGTLYSVNVLGASVGALITPWVLIRSYGIRGAVAFSAAANLVAGLCALLFGRMLANAIQSSTSHLIPPRVGGANGPDTKSPALRLWILLYALSGFVALSLEIVWFRVLDVATKSTAFSASTFSASDSAPSRACTGRCASARPFRLLQCLLAVYAAAALLLLARAPLVGDLPQWFYAYWGQHDEFVPGRDPDPGTLSKLYFLMPAALFGIPTTTRSSSFDAAPPGWPPAV